MWCQIYNHLLLFGSDFIFVNVNVLDNLLKEVFTRAPRAELVGANFTVIMANTHFSFSIDRS